MIIKLGYEESIKEHKLKLSEISAVEDEGGVELALLDNDIITTPNIEAINPLGGIELLINADKEDGILELLEIHEKYSGNEIDNTDILDFLYDSLAKMLGL